MSAKMIRLSFVLCCCASWTMAQSSPGTATPPARTATPPAQTATPSAYDRDSVGTTLDTTDNSAKQPEWIVAERDFSGKHAGIEFSGTSYVWQQHVAFDGEPEYDQ